MTATGTEGEGDGSAPPPTPRRVRRVIASSISVIGELLITAGLIMGLFVAYSLWWTNVQADKEARKQGDAVRDRWAGGPGALDTKDGIGFLHVPGMKTGEILVKKGTEPKILNDGVAGYYTKPVKSALPEDDKGNFSLAAHRDGHGAKFHNIDKLKDPDMISPGMEWCIRRGFPITIAETKRVDWPRAYREATEKYSGQVKLSPDGLRVLNYVAGLPFPNIDPMDAMARLQLARALALSGDTVKAKNAYSDILTLWKDADADLPILKKARAEYARLP